MKPERFFSIMLLTLLLSCENNEEQVERSLGEVSFETNQYVMNSSFEIDLYIDGNKIEKKDSWTEGKNIHFCKLDVGVHNYEVKIYTFNGEPSKSVKGRFIIEEDKIAKVFINFKEYNSWI